LVQQLDPKFAQVRLREGVDAIVSGDVATGWAIWRDSAKMRFVSALVVCAIIMLVASAAGCAGANWSGRTRPLG
jgi:hypothetical protein